MTGDVRFSFNELRSMENLRFDSVPFTGYDDVRPALSGIALLWNELEPPRRRPAAASHQRAASPDAGSPLVRSQRGNPLLGPALPNRRVAAGVKHRDDLYAVLVRTVEHAVGEATYNTFAYVREYHSVNERICRNPVEHLLDLCCEFWAQARLLVVPIKCLVEFYLGLVPQDNW
jgi:hypothetical protein